MDVLKSFVAALEPALPMGLALVVIVAVLFVVHFLLEKRFPARPRQSFRRQLAMLVLTLVGLLIVIVVSPLSDAQRGQLLGLIGILLSAAIALSSTTFLGNALAGVMLRVVQSFRMGDFIRVGEHFGRVSERGLFHTEIQTEHRDLMTLPNLYLVTNPVKVVRTSGTILSAEISLGYDVPRKDVERLLAESATAAELTDPFVHVMELGDFSVTYRVGGLLADVKQLISARSRLREMMLDNLHAGGVEIVSPTFMNTRAVAERRVFIPEAAPETAKLGTDATAETIAFDKAEEAESAEKLQERHDELLAQIEESEKRRNEAATDEEKDRLRRQIDQLEAVRDRVAELVQRKTEELDQ